MGMMGAMVEHAQQVHALLKLKMAAAKLEKEMPSEPEHLAFAYSILPKLSESFHLLILQLRPEVRDAVCIFYLVLRALDTVEDDTSIPPEIRVPILLSFHRHIYDRDWHFSCGAKDFKVLMDKFHYVSTAFLKLDISYQAAIEDTIKRVGAGMAIFIRKEVETLSDYDEYCHYVSGLVGLGLSKLFYLSGLEDLAPDSLSNSVGLFLQKVNIIRDYFEDINDIPKPRKFWPHQIWSKYSNKLEDFKREEDSTKALQCLNEMASNALIHVEDCLLYTSALKDFSIFRLCATSQILSIAMLALCYGNLDVFRGGVKMPLGLTARLIDQTRTMSDVYGVFFEFSSIMKSKVNESDPNASLTRKRIEAIQKACISSGLLNKRGCGSYKKQHQYTSIMIRMLVLMLAVLFTILSIK